MFVSRVKAERKPVGVPQAATQPEACRLSEVVPHLADGGPVRKVCSTSTFIRHTQERSCVVS